MSKPNLLLHRPLLAEQGYMHIKCIHDEIEDVDMLWKLVQKRHNSKRKEENAVGDVRRITITYKHFGQYVQYFAQVLRIHFCTIWQILVTLEFFLRAQLNKQVWMRSWSGQFDDAKKETDAKKRNNTSQSAKTGRSILLNFCTHL